MTRKTVCIVGLGLIGGSIALGIRRDHPEIRLIGHDKSIETMKTAVLDGLVDETFADFREAAEQADVIFLCLPIYQILIKLDELETFSLRPNVLVTDSGSTKSEIVTKAADKAFKFIGGHPMAGSHKSGIIAAEVNLFENAYYILTEASDELKDLLSGLHAKILVLEAKEHDQITSQVSHFPHILATALLEQSEQFSDLHPLVNRMAAGGFRDMTRIAESDSEMWTDIALSNKEALLSRIHNFMTELDKIARMFEMGEAAFIRDFFEAGKRQRTAMEIHRGALPNFYDLSLLVPDEKGVVLRVLNLLEDISITNIKIQEDNREDIQGTLRISFRNEADLKLAAKIIQEKTNFVIFSL